MKIGVPVFIKTAYDYKFKNKRYIFISKKCLIILTPLNPTFI